MRQLSAALAIASLSIFGAAWAAPAPLLQISLTLKDHRFIPSTIILPAEQKVRIVLTNQDGATEEFDSHDLKVEQVVTPHGKVSFNVGPLQPGTYAFMGEFHPDLAQGRITVPAPAR